MENPSKEGRRKRQRSFSPCEGNEAKKPCIGSYHRENVNLILNGSMPSSVQQESNSRSFPNTISFREAAYENHFIEHLRAFQDYPYLRELLEAPNPLWHRFVATLLQMDMNSKLSTGNNPKVRFIYYGSTYISFRIEEDQATRTSISCFFLGVCVQIMMSKEQFSFREQMYENNEFVDQLVDWLHQQVTSGALQLGNCLNPLLFNHYYVRKFAKVNCMLRFLKLSIPNSLSSTDG